MTPRFGDFNSLRRSDLRGPCLMRRRATGASASHVPRRPGSLRDAQSAANPYLPMPPATADWPGQATPSGNTSRSPLTQTRTRQRQSGRYLVRYHLTSHRLTPSRKDSHSTTHVRFRLNDTGGWKVYGSAHLVDPAGRRIEHLCDQGRLAGSRHLRCQGGRVMVLARTSAVPGVDVRDSRIYTSATAINV